MDGFILIYGPIWWLHWYPSFDPSRVRKLHCRFSLHPASSHRIFPLGEHATATKKNLRFIGFTKTLFLSAWISLEYIPAISWSTSLMAHVWPSQIEESGDGRHLPNVRAGDGSKKLDRCNKNFWMYPTGGRKIKRETTTLNKL